MERMIVIALALVITSGCRESKTGTPLKRLTNPAKNDHLHFLTWQYREGVYGTTPDKAVFYWNGQYCGAGRKAIERIKRIKLKAGSIVRIKDPWILSPSRPDYMPPYPHKEMMRHWWECGVVVEFEEQWVGENLPRITRLVWLKPPPEPPEEKPPLIQILPSGEGP